MLRIEPPAASRLAWWPANDPSRLRALTGTARIRLPGRRGRRMKVAFARESGPSSQPASGPGRAVARTVGRVQSTARGCCAACPSPIPVGRCPAAWLARSRVASLNSSPGPLAALRAAACGLSLDRARPTCPAPPGDGHTVQHGDHPAPPLGLWRGKAASSQTDKWPRRPGRLWAPVRPKSQSFFSSAIDGK